MSRLKNISVHDAQRGVHVPPEDVRAQSPVEPASSETRRRASPPHAPPATPLAAGALTRCSWCGHTPDRRTSNSGIPEVYTHGGYTPSVSRLLVRGPVPPHVTGT